MSFSLLLVLLTVTFALSTDTAHDAIRVVISEGCVAQGDASDVAKPGKEVSLSPDAPLVLTHQIRLVPPGPGSCRCDGLEELRKRVDQLEREVSELREKCGDPESPGCCSSRESKGPGCSVAPDPPLCPGDCSDQGRCVDGKCVCFSGFSGPDCSHSSCPGDCSNRGRCVEGQCECDPGFSRPDCSRSSCPGDCSNRGRCVNGRCICDEGFAGENCGEKKCPGNCNSRGRCVDGRCICEEGFAGENCGEKTCPGNCNNKGRCVNGRCICEEGFGGEKCLEKTCPGNCNNKGRCVNGKCVCRRGFSGADCGECQDGLTGANCDTVMSSVEDLQTKDLTQSSVTVVWTQPPIQYESYLLSFSSQKDDLKVETDVPGSQSFFTQTGLAPGQTYIVTLTGKTGDRLGAQSSTQFTTLPSGPSDLRVVKTSTSSAVVQWEPSPSAIDRYRLSVSRSDGRGRGQELTFDPGTSSAHITQLEAGLRYDITLVAEKGRSQSEPISTSATPGSSNKLVAALTVSPTSGHDDSPFKFPTKNASQTGKPSKAHTRPEFTKVIRRIKVNPSAGDSSPASKSGPENTDLAIVSKHDPLQKLLTDTFQNVNITAFDIRLTEPEHSDLDADAEEVARQIMQGSKSRLSLSTSMKSPQSSDKPLFTSLFFIRSQTTTVSPSITTREATFSESHDASKTYTENQPKPNYRQPQPNRTVIQRLRPNSWQFRNQTLKKGDDSRHATLTKEENLGDKGVSEGKNRDRIQSTHQGTAPVRRGSNFSPSQSRNHSNLKTQSSSKPLITSSLFEKSPTTMASPTSATPLSTFSDSDGSKTETENQPLHSDQQQQPNHPVIRHLRPNLWRFQNQTLKNVHRSMPTSTKVTSSPLALEKVSLNNENVVNSDNNKASERENQHRIQSTNQETGAVRRFPLNGRLNGQNLTRSHPNLRFFRRPAQINKTETVKPKEEAPSSTDSPPDNVVNVHRKVNFTSTRPGFNRSRLASSRRPHPYMGPFQNRTRLPFRSPQRNLTAHNRPNTAILKATFPSKGTGNENVSLEEVNNGLIDPNVLERDSATSESYTDTPGIQNRTVIGQTSEPGHMHGSGIGEIVLDKEYSHGIHIEPQSDRRAENVQEVSEDNDDSSNLSEIIFQRQEPTKTPNEVKIDHTNPDLVAYKQDHALHEKQRDFHNKSGAANFRRPLKAGTRPLQTRRKILPHNQLRNMTRKGFKTNPGFNRTKLILENPEDSLHKLTGGSQADEMNIKLPAAREKDETEVDLYGEDATGNEKLALTRDTEKSDATNRQTQPNRAVNHRLRPNFIQFRNKTGLNVRDRDGASSLLTKINTMPMETTVNPKDRSLTGKEKIANLDDNSVSTGESQSHSERAKDGVLESFEESVLEEVEATGGSRRRNLDEMFPPESDYKVTVLGRGSGVLSRLHKLVISTGPEPPSDLVFSHVTEDSVTVSWSRPKSKVSGFKVTYTHSEDGEPVSVSLDQGNSSVGLSHLTPGSVYEVSVLSLLGLDESDPISKKLYTLPDPPTDVRAVNVTDTGALLLWRPALATVDHYTIVYGAGTGSEIRVSVSGNTVEKQLKDLEPATTYSVTISSQLDTRMSRDSTTSFTTTSGSSGPGDLRATHVKPRSATLSWKPPSRPVIGYTLSYWTEGQRKEVSVGATVTQLNLTRLFPGSDYTVELRTDGGDEVLTTTFTTGSLQFPFPSDCTQEQLNGLTESGLVDIFPLGKQGAALSVWCDMDTDGGGWTVFQRRKDGSVDFFRTWKEYVQGFGDASGEFWLGLNALHTLTSRSRMTLRVDLSDGQDSAFAQYSTFEVAKRNYRLTVGGYSGTAGDSMAYHNNRIFSTKDRDPASFITRCAMSYRGGWWYKNCHEANLNGLYGISSKHQGIVWTSWKGKETSIPFTEMKMRPTDFIPNKNNYRA